VSVRLVRSLLAACALLVPLALARVALADVRLDVRTDRTSLSLDDTLTLQVTIQSQGAVAPKVDMPQLDGFQIVSQQVQQPMQFSFSFGAQAVVQSSTIYTFVLQPVRTGTLVIKSVRAELDGRVQTSRPIQITVTGGPQQPGQPPSQAQPGAQNQQNASSPTDGAEVDPIAFVRTVADKTEPYEGEQVTVTVYLYVRERLQSTPNIETEPATDGLWIQDLLPAARTLQPTRQVVGNALYAVYLLKRLAAFPLRSGEITIGALSLELDTSSVFDMFAPDRGHKSLKRSSQPVVLHVKPLPEAGRPPGEVAVGRFQLSTKLDRAQAVTGDAVTLSATVQGKGNLRSVLLKAPVLAGVDVLQPETKDLVESADDLVGGTREYRWLLVPREPGHLRIPGLSLATFDPVAQRYQHLASEPLALEVVGHALPSAQTAADQKPSGPAVDQKAQPQEQLNWPPIRTQSALLRSSARLMESSWYPWALAMPGLLWLAVVSAGGVRRRLLKRAQTGTGRVLREAERRLQNAETAAREGATARFHAEASAALLTLLEARLEETLSGLTRAELQARLAARGMDPAQVAETLKALERSEFARFGSSSGSAAELEAEAQTVRGLWKRLGAFAPSVPKEGP
jgi:hypothetical protein